MVPLGGGALGVVPLGGGALGVVLLGADAVEEVDVAVDCGLLCTAGALSGGTVTPALTAVTEAGGALTETAWASEPSVFTDVSDLVAAPIANAIPNGIATAASSTNHRHRTADVLPVGGIAPMLLLGIVPLSICSPPECWFHRKS